MDLMHAFERAGRSARSLEQRLKFAPALVARLTTGVVFATTGWGKLHNLDKVTEFFRELGIPAPGFHAHFVSSIELVGGALLVVGLLTRWAALPLMGTMVVALITAKASDIAGLNDLFGTVEFTYLALLLWLALFGAGSLSLDALLRKRAPRADKAPSASLLVPHSR